MQKIEHEQLYEILSFLTKIDTNLLRCKIMMT